MTCKYKIISVALLFTISCNNSKNNPSNITSEIEGKYLFKYPSGQIEYLFIKLDSTFCQNLYSSENDYLSNRKPLYENNGNWTIEGNKLEFNHWLDYCYLRNPDSILVVPDYGNLSDVYWYAETNEHNSEITVYSENGYIFKKQNNVSL